MPAPEQGAASQPPAPVEGVFMPHLPRRAGENWKLCSPAGLELTEGWAELRGCKAKPAVPFGQGTGDASQLDLKQQTEETMKLANAD